MAYNVTIVKHKMLKIWHGQITKNDYYFGWKRLCIVEQKLRLIINGCFGSWKWMINFEMATMQFPINGLFCWLAGWR